MKISMLCSGSTGNCCVIEDMNTKLMIDCGGTKGHLMSCLDRIHVILSDLEALLLTHGHTDHISQIKMMKGIPTYGTFTCDKQPIQIVGTHEQFIIGNLKVTTLPLSHDFPKTVGYMIEGSKKLVYITDTGYVNEKLFNEIMNADYIVMECNHDPKMLMNTSRPFLTKQRIMSSEGHLSNTECARILSKIIGENTKEIILAHISREGNTQELALRSVCEGLTGYGIDSSRLHIYPAGAFELLQIGETVHD